VRFSQSAELTVFCGALVGASLGFLWFKLVPGGDLHGRRRSLALGGALGTVAILIKQELLLGIVGGVFVIEGLSVIIQVASFKLTGQRVFRMAPLHHHFELIGWSEPKVIHAIRHRRDPVRAVQSHHAEAEMTEHMPRPALDVQGKRVAVAGAPAAASPRRSSSPAVAHR